MTGISKHKIFRYKTRWIELYKKMYKHTVLELQIKDDALKHESELCSGGFDREWKVSKEQNINKHSKESILDRICIL